MQIISFGSRPVFGSETITVSSTPIGLTLSKIRKQVGADASQIQRARLVYITIEGAEVRVCYDKSVTVTTTTNGHIAPYDFTLDGTQVLEDVRFIATGSDATMRVTYFG